MLRNYHKVGLLEPAEVDPDTGYRSYTVEQIATAQVIRRFRDLDMPLDEIQALLSAPDVETRNELLTSHLGRLEVSLARTQEAVTSLRNLLDHPPPTTRIDHRHLDVTSAAAVIDTVDLADAWAWSHGALGELSATLTVQGISPTGPAGGIYTSDLYTEERGSATIFVPCEPTPRPMGRVTAMVIPTTDLATVVHHGPHTDIDRAYGALADHVTRHAIAVDRPIREYYLVSPSDTDDASLWGTEVGWPIFQTRQQEAECS